MILYRRDIFSLKDASFHGGMSSENASFYGGMSFEDAFFHSGISFEMTMVLFGPLIKIKFKFNGHEWRGIKKNDNSNGVLLAYL